MATLARPWRKLGIKTASRLLLIHPPENLLRLLDPLPGDVDIVSDEDENEVDVILLFSLSLEILKGELLSAMKRLCLNGGLWLAWPKRASGIESDLSDSVVRETGLNAGLVDNKVCSIDPTWSALRFVYRLKDRQARS